MKASIKDKSTHKDNVITKPKQNVKRKTSQLSETGTGSSNPSLKRMKIKQTQIKYKNGGKGNLPKPQKEHLKSTSRMPSSDYGDDFLSDLPSPSTFLEPPACLPVQPVSQKSFPTELKEQIIDSIALPTPAPDVQMEAEQGKTTVQEVHPEMTHQTRGMSPPNPSSHQEIIGICDNTMSEPTPEILTSPAIIKSSATSLPLSTSPANTPRSPKGKEKFLGEIAEKSEQPGIPQYPLINSLHEILSVPPRCLNLMGTEAESSGSEGAEGGWEDIDRMLYEEYKDIVNYY